MVTGFGAMNLRERGRFRKILYQAEHFTTLLGREAVKKDGIFSRYELLHCNASFLVGRAHFTLLFGLSRNTKIHVCRKLNFYFLVHIRLCKIEFGIAVALWKILFDNRPAGK